MPHPLFYRSWPPILHYCFFICYLRGHTWQHSRIIPNMCSKINLSRLWGPTWYAANRTSISHMQSKHPTHGGITLPSPFDFAFLSEFCSLFSTSVSQSHDNFYHFPSKQMGFSFCSSFWLYVSFLSLGPYTTLALHMHWNWCTSCDFFLFLKLQHSPRAIHASEIATQDAHCLCSFLETCTSKMPKSISVLPLTRGWESKAHYLQLS